MHNYFDNNISQLTSHTKGDLSGTLIPPAISAPKSDHVSKGLVDGINRHHGFDLPGGILRPRNEARPHRAPMMEIANTMVIDVNR